jgi:membrane associated rhomboid family serine protease
MTARESQIDYSRHSEAELVEMFERMDPRYAPEECARLAQWLTKQGYHVTPGGTGPGSAEPTASKLQALIGSAQPLVCEVQFGKVAGPFSYLELTRNDLGFVGCGKLQTDGIYVYLSGRLTRSTLPALVNQSIQLANRQIVNVEAQGRFIRFEYSRSESGDGAITLQLADEATVAALVAALPKTRKKDFRSQIKANAEFETRLARRSPRTPVTFALITVNTVVFMAMLFGGAEWFRPVGHVQIAWGSNFGPYTTDGQWWRLLTSLFIHFGVIHVTFNMLALASFGPLVERLYGSTVYLLIYLLSGTLGSLASVAWHPAINSAGASGAILGICGALLAAQIRVDDRFPADILRPIRYSTLLFLAWVLYSSFKSSGVDYAAHLGGLLSGFLLGSALAPGYVLPVSRA